MTGHSTKDDLVKQDSLAPTRKVGRGYLVAGVILTAVFALVLFFPEKVPSDVTTALWGLVIAYVIPFLAQYFTLERRESQL